jgi:uncharacterized protein YutE (UPF0331/DUF86 family)/predicted nucleotidyltransferase
VIQHEQVCRELGLGLVLLFGSAARGQAGESSDFDVAVLPRGPLSICPSDLGHSLGQIFGHSLLDLSWLPDCSWLLWQEVARDAQVLFESRPGMLQEFRIEAALRHDEASVWRDRSQRYIGRFLQGEMTLNRDLVQRKLALMSQYLQEVEPILLLSPQEFVSQPLAHHAAERIVELVVECAAYINSEVAQAVSKIPPSDYYSSFYAMAATGWVDQETVHALAEWARIRNALVHRYEEVGLEDLLVQIQKAHPRWRSYVAQVYAELLKS